MGTVQNRDEKPGLPIVAGAPYDEEDRFADAILRGIENGIARRKAREAEKQKAPPERRILPPGFREVGKPGEAFVIPGFPKPA